MNAARVPPRVACVLNGAPRGVMCLQRTVNCYCRASTEASDVTNHAGLRFALPTTILLYCSILPHRGFPILFYCSILPI